MDFLYKKSLFSLSLLRKTEGSVIEGFIIPIVLLRNIFTHLCGTLLAHSPYDNGYLCPVMTPKKILMKKFITLFLAAAIVYPALAQSNPTKNDPVAKRILDAVSAKFKTFKSPKAAFTYSVENAAGKVLSSKKGSVVMKGNKYKVFMDGMEIFSDGRTIWNYDKSAKEVTVNTVESNGSAMTPQRMFTNFYDKDFYYKYNGQKTVAGRTMQEIELTPTDKTKPFHKVYLLVDKAKNMIYSARFLEKSGGRYSYTVTNLQPTAAVADTAFVFNKAKYPGVEVIDLR